MLVPTTIQSIRIVTSTASSFEALCLQVRAGEGQSEADNYVLTNTVFKTSISNGLSSQGKRQVARQVVRLTAMSALVLLTCCYCLFFMLLIVRLPFLSDCAGLERAGCLS